MCDLPVELPHDYDVENCVIRELLFGPDECLPVIRKYGGEDLFSKMLYGIVFQAACEMIETGVGIDQLTMTAHLAGTGRLEMIGGEIEVAALFGDPAYYGNIADHCRMLAELAARREITRHCRYAVQRSVDRAESLPELIGDLGDTLRKAAALLGESGHSLSDDVRDWVLSSNGHFMSSDVVTDLALSSRVDKKNCSKILKRLVEEGLIERWGNRRGCFRKIDGDCARIDLSIPRCEPLPFRWPMELERHVELMPGNVAVIAGEPNAGKTAFLLDFVRRNMSACEIHYFSSEMGAQEMQKRLDRFGIPPEQWTFTPWERVGDFPDIIRPDAINIIDYLEAYDEFYKLGGEIAKIHRRLRGGAALVAIQKNRNTDIGRGGMITLDKPRLYLSLSQGECSIVKAKNWAGNRNPNGLSTRFTLRGGSEFVHGEWCAAG